MLRLTFQSSPWKSLSDSAALDKLLLQTYAELGRLWATRLKISERSSVSSGVFLLMLQGEYSVKIEVMQKEIYSVRILG